MRIRKKTSFCRPKGGKMTLRSPSRAVGGLRLQAVDQFGNMTKYRYKQPKAHQLEQAIPPCVASPLGNEESPTIHHGQPG